MIRSQAFRVIDFLTQKKLPTKLQDWIRNTKMQQGVHVHRDKKFYLISLGQRPTSGFTLKLEKIEEKEEKILAYMREEVPSSGGFYNPVITYPYVLVAAEKPIEVWLVDDEKNKPTLLFS